LAAGGLFPNITAVREVSLAVAHAVIEAAVDEGLAEPLLDVDAAVERASWTPQYHPYRPA
jgi:malic enzyme